MKKVKVMVRTNNDRVNRTGIIFHIVRKAKKEVDVFWVIGKAATQYQVQLEYKETYLMLMKLAGRVKQAGLFRNELVYNPRTKKYRFNPEGTVRVMAVKPVTYMNAKIDLKNRIKTIILEDKNV